MVMLEAVDIETSSEKYATRFQGEAGAWLLRVQANATLEMLKKWPAARVLEVGGGHAQLTGHLINAGYRVTVLGSSDACQQRIRHFVDTGACEFHSGNMLHLPYEDRSFDVVIAYHLLSHLVEWRRFVTELTRVSDKAVLVDYPTYRSLNGISSHLFWLKKQIEGNTRQFISYEESEVLHFFRQRGFRRSSRYAKFFLPMVMHRMLKSPRMSAAIENGFRAAGMTSLFGSPVITCLVRKEGDES